MIESITIRNFKSLANVTIKLDKFNCLVGMNGTGKSTILQAMDFLSQQMHGFLYLWMENRGWESKDLYSRTGDFRASSRGIFFIVKYRLNDGGRIKWSGNLNRSSMRLTRERVELEGETMLEVSEGKYTLDDQTPHEIAFEYRGSILSSLKESLLYDELVEFRDAIRNIRSLELLSPHLLRKRSRSQDKDIGTGGEKLSGFLATIKGKSKDRLLHLLQKFYPQLHDFKIATVKGGWKRLVVSEAHLVASGPKMGKAAYFDTEAIQLNDGLLRILAILAQAEVGKTSLLLLDEIENGINPEIVENLVDTLVNSPMQIIVTSHSPMILNYLSDSVAREAVQFIYKNPYGQTRVRRFFDIPRIGKKLNYMGAGEAFVDTNLQDLSLECVEQDKAEDEL
ncbi:AAA family ATPase [Chromobacterium violaceum]|uniref:AAA family ATPase n=1 Tax=Chromobacterium violaceum TaxID=536 RepID=UPI001BEA1241|nr:ATP-binding protein [Chromobacterium violaceum]MBT2866337.1 AAA family ATPase [Chromobacterium violaceum]